MGAKFEFVECAYQLGKVFKRNIIKTKSQIADIKGTDQFCTYFTFTREVNTYMKKNGNSISGFKGMCYADFLPLDIDNADLQKALECARGVCERLKGFGVDLYSVQVYFSGSKGFHIMIPSELFGFEPSVRLPEIFRDIAKELMGGVAFDDNVYQTNRQWRIPNTLNSKGGRYKILLAISELMDLGIEDIRELAKEPREIEIEVGAGGIELNTELVEMYERAVKSSLVVLKMGKGDTDEVIDEGGRDNYITREAGRLIKAQYSDAKARVMLLALNDSVCNPPLAESDIDRILKSIRRKDNLNLFKAEAVEFSTIKSLMDKELPPLQYVVPNMFTLRGVYLLAGAGKMGKSWLAFDMSLKIASGKIFLGRQSVKTKILYVDLETGEHSLKGRMQKLINKDIYDLDNLFYTHSFNRIGQGFEEDMERAIAEGFQVFIIDVLAKIRGGNDKNKKEYDRDYDDITVMKKLAMEHNVCFILITHLRKMPDPDDPWNTINGSVGLTGSVDGMLILKRKRGEQRGTLSVIGREVREQELALEFDPDNCQWKYIGTGEEVKAQQAEDAYYKSAVVITIKELLEKKDSWSGSFGELFNITEELASRMFSDALDVQDVPTSAKSLSVKLAVLAPRLRVDGIFYTVKETMKANIVTITRKLKTP